MKIRTDFVTNSSSSSFVTVQVKTKKGELIKGCLEASQPIDVDAHNGCIHIEAKAFETAETLEPIIRILADWVYAAMEDPDCCSDEYDEIIQYYGYQDINKIIKMKSSNIEKIEINTSMEYWDEPYGRTSIKYDFVKKELTEESVDESADEYDEE